APLQFPPEKFDPDLRIRGNAGGDPPLVSLHLRRENAGVVYPQTGRPYPEWAGLRPVRPRGPAVTPASRPRAGVWLPFRGGGLSDRSQRDSAGIARSIARARRPVPRRPAP